MTATTTTPTPITSNSNNNNSATANKSGTSKFGSLKRYFSNTTTTTSSSSSPSIADNMKSQEMIGLASNSTIKEPKVKVKKVAIAKELSALAVYCKAKRFSGFKNSRK